ncbi:MAG: hypothetical protein ACLP8S_11305 [Solirubrobacteraceae bacterium]
MRTAPIACLVYVAQTRVRDELAEMFCKRRAAVTKRARGELDRLREEGRELSERLIDHYRELLERLDPACSESTDPLVALALALAREAVERAGGFASELSDVERVAAHHANNYMPLVYTQIGKDRSTMYEFTRVVELEATSAERSVLDALEHAVAHRQLTRDLIPDHRGGRPVDLSFASEQWQRLVCPHTQPGRLDRRHVEACVFTYLAAELRTGDIAVKGSEAYANWAARLLSWEQCEPLIGEFCAASGLPATAEAFVGAVRSRLAARTSEVDAGYAANTDLTIDPQTGRPTLKRRRGNECQWPSEIPQLRPDNSPLVAIVSPRWWPSNLPTCGLGWGGGQVRGLTLLPVVAWASL